MKLYEIDQAILACVDEETGEVDFDRLTELQTARNEKIEGIAAWVLDLSGDVAKIEAELFRLRKLKEQTENKIRSLKNYLAFALNHEAYRGDTVRVGFRRSESVEIDEDAIIPEAYISVRIAEAPDKAKLKQALKNGEVIDGVHIEEHWNTNIN